MNTKKHVIIKTKYIEQSSQTSTRHLNKILDVRVLTVQRKIRIESEINLLTPLVPVA